jgi:hypothetical protein
MKTLKILWGIKYNAQKKVSPWRFMQKILTIQNRKAKPIHSHHLPFQMKDLPFYLLQHNHFKL